MLHRSSTCLRPSINRGRGTMFGTSIKRDSHDDQKFGALGKDIETKKKIFKEQIRCIKKDNLLEEFMLKLMILEEGLMPPPAQNLKNRTISKQLEGVYLKHTDDMFKRQLDERHKPLFLRLTREGYRLNGKLAPELFNDFREVEKIELAMKVSWPNYIYDIMHDEESNWIAMMIYTAVITCIIVSVIRTMLASVEEYYDHRVYEFNMLEMILTFIFTLEYGMRVIIVRNRFQYLGQVMNIFDMLAILPWYILQLGFFGEKVPKIGGVMRALRLSRIAKMRQLATPYTMILLRSLSNTITGAGVAIALLLFICTAATGALVFECEKNAHSGFDNILKSMWWSIVTLSTVGYGDMSPSTNAGYIMATATILVGILLSSLIIMVVGQYYVDFLIEVYHKKLKD